MINRLLSRIASAIALLAITNMASAQVKIGGDPSTVNNAALLELESTSKGVLLPRLSKGQMDSIANPVAALMIWCTDCIPKGLKIYDGTSWSSFSTSTAPISVMSAINCGGTLAGSYYPDIPMTASNTKTVTITGSPGSYDATTAIVNGVRFSKSGTKAAAGAESIVLQATGTPLAPGTFTYNVNANGALCSFTVTFRDATYNCAGAVITMPTVNLVNGSSYTGTVTVPYTNGNGRPYDVSTPLTSEGLTLTLAPGTYSPAGGTLTYNLSGTYTGTTNNPLFGITVTGCGPSFYIGGANFSQAPTPVGGLTPSGQYKVGVPMTSFNYMDIYLYVSTPGYWSLSTPTVNGVRFSANNYISYNSTYWTEIYATGTPLAAGTFNYVVTDNRGRTMNFNVTFTP